MTALVDSHCHLDFPELAADIPGALADMARHGVSHYQGDVATALPAHR